MVLPYLKGLMVLKEILHIVLVYLLWCFCIQYLVLNNWYQSTFLGQTLWVNIFYFCSFFFSEKKKEGRDILEVFGIFLCKICIWWRSFNVRWTRSTILLNKAHYGS
jgi:hypothetical protein